MPHVHLSLQHGRRPDPQADEAPPLARRRGARWSSGCARARPGHRHRRRPDRRLPDRERGDARGQPLDRRASSASSTATSSPTRRAPARPPRGCRKSTRRPSAARAAELRAAVAAARARLAGEPLSARRSRCSPSATGPATRANFARVAPARGHRAGRDRDRHPHRDRRRPAAHERSRAGPSACSAASARPPSG